MNDYSTTTTELSERIGFVKCQVIEESSPLVVLINAASRWYTRVSHSTGRPE